MKGSRLRKAARKRIIALSALGKAAPKRIVAVSALVGAAVLTWAVSFYAPGVAGKVTGLFREDPPPTPEFQIRVGPEFNGTWLYPSTRSDLGNPRPSSATPTSTGVGSARRRPSRPPTASP